ncbi:hypothetical protein [Pararcticibacter amylolyticus]|nr:hypothetical protein [Pararcticibacter amylolyticus]
MKISIMLVCMMCCYEVAYSQDFPKVVPPSPQSQSFEKYVNYRVALYNGVPEIDIPLHEIQLNTIKIPINLSYHASGIKYMQYDGNIGVGWTLNPGYRVNRVIYGKPDDSYEMPTDTINKITNVYFPSNGGLRNDQMLAPFVQSYYMNNATNSDKSVFYDGEYDMFTYMLPSGNGHFIIKNRQNYAVDFLEKVNNTVEFNVNNAPSQVERLQGGKIKDESGTTYYFGKSTDGIYTSEKMNTNGGQWDAYSTSWPINDIVSATGEQVHFNYTTAYEIRKNPTNITLSVREAIEGQQVPNGPLSPTSISKTNGADTRYHTFYVNQITTPSEKVVFIADKRSDQLNLNVDQYYIKEINIYSTIGNKMLKKIKFFSSRCNPHWLLDSVQICDSSRVIQTYKFEYFDLPDTQKSNPWRFSSYYADQWGYYHGGGSGASYVPTPYLHNDIAAGDVYKESAWFSFPVDQLISTAWALKVDKSRADTNTVKAFTLRKILFPTGGYREYEYDSNISLNNVSGGGLRVRRIKSFDNAGKSLTKIYKYGQNESGIGSANGLVNSSLFKSVNKICKVFPPWGQMSQYNDVGCIYNYSTVITGDGSAEEHLAVHYPQVSVYDYDNSAGVCGKTIYNFSNLGTDFSFQTDMYNRFVPNGTSGLNISGYDYWQKPVLQSSYVYASTPENGFSLKHSTINEYKTIWGTVYPGIKVSQYAFYEGDNIYAIESLSDPNQAYFSPYDSPYYSNSQYSPRLFSFYCWMPYSVGSGINLLTKSTETDYSASGNVVYTKALEYNNYNQLFRTTVFSSDDKKIVEEIKYPLDYPGLANNSVYSIGINNLLSKNAVDKVIERSSYIIDPSNQKKLVNSELYQYKSDLPVPLKAERIFTDTPLSDFVSSSGVNGMIQIDSRYKPYISFTGYDAIGNITEVSKFSDAPVCYIWGYNKRYPVAQITGANVKNVFYEGFEEIGGNSPKDICKAGHYSYIGSYNKILTNLTNGNYTLSYWQKAGANSWTLKRNTVTVSSNSYQIDINAGQIDEIRLYPSEAKMTTYTYDPLVGITSVIDTRDAVSYFYYDNFNRLKTIKDEDGNVIKSYAYHYKTSE